MGKTYTAEKIIKDAISLFDENNSNDYIRIGMTALNTILEETFSINNGIREIKGLLPLDESPDIESLSDIVPYEKELIKRAIIYGVASAVYWKDGDSETFAMLHEKYVNGCNALRKVKVITVGAFNI